MIAADIARARDALAAIPPNLPRDDWHRIGRAAIACGLTVDELVAWSSTAPNYTGERDVRAAFRTIKPDGGTGPGTLFQAALDAGWNDGKATSDPVQKIPAKAAARPAELPRRPAAGMCAAEVFARCKQASNAHPYVTAKAVAGVPLDGLRTVPNGDPLRIAGECMAGALVVPCRRGDGSIASLQCITTGSTADRLKANGKPTKLNLPGHPLEGWHMVGEPVPGAPLFVVEGIGQAWACWQATGHAAVVCFGWGRVRKVATELRERDPAARLVLVPDAGKEAEAEAIARDLSTAVACMTEGEPQNFDVNDYAQREGADALALLLEQAREPEPPAPLLKPVSVRDVLTNPAAPPAFVWHGYLPRGVVSLLGAHGGTGKSTIALMLSVCTALGRPLFGMNTELCKVLFVSLEDGAGVVRHRLAGICRAWGIDPQQLDGRLLVVDGTENPELFAAEARGAGESTPTHHSLTALAQAHQIGLLVVDNASDAFGGDEINRRQVRAFMRSLAQVARSTNCAALLLAQVDKNTSRARKAEGGEGYSGSTAWHNSARSRLFMSRADDGLLTLEHQKSNLAKLQEPIALMWADGALPVLATDSPDAGGFADRTRGRIDDAAAAALLKIIAEFASRDQFCSPVATARNNVFATLRSEPAFQALKLNSDATRRILNQCQRAGWIAAEDYRSHDRKTRQKWTVTAEGRSFAGIAPCAPCAPTCHESVEGTERRTGAPCAPCSVGGVGESAHTEQSATETPT